MVGNVGISLQIYLMLWPGTRLENVPTSRLNPVLSPQTNAGDLVKNSQICGHKQLKIIRQLIKNMKNVRPQTV